MSNKEKDTSQVEQQLKSSTENQIEKQDRLSEENFNKDYGQSGSSKK